MPQDVYERPSNANELDTHVDIDRRYGKLRFIPPNLWVRKRYLDFRVGYLGQNIFHIMSLASRLISMLRSVQMKAVSQASCRGLQLSKG